MTRKQFTTTISESIQKDFKEKCSQNNDKMNDVLETFMTSYINGEFKVKREVTYNLERTNKEG